MTPEQIREARAQVQKADKVVDQLCDGTRRWTMCVPARPDDDPDLVIGSALNVAMRALDALEDRDAALYASAVLLGEARAECERLRAGLERAREVEHWHPPRCEHCGGIDDALDPGEQVTG